MAKETTENKEITATSYLLSDDAKAFLKKMAEDEGRSMSKELDKIIIAEAKRRKVELPTEKSKK